MFQSLNSNSPRHVHTYLQAFTPPDFYDAPFKAVAMLLSFNALSLPEDDILMAMLCYVCKRANVPTTPKAWTTQQRTSVLPELTTLFSSIRYLSLTTSNFLHVVEPLALLSDTQLIEKYRFDALCNASSDPLSFALVSKWYPLERRSTVMSSSRGTPVIMESAHPYEPGWAVAHVSINSWAPHMLIEFDRRTRIGPGASLKLFADREQNAVIADWHDMWHHHGERHSIKWLVCDGADLYLRIECEDDAQPDWGWKLIAMPLVREDDFKGEDAATCDHPE